MSVPFRRYNTGLARIVPRVNRFDGRKRTGLGCDCDEYANVLEYIPGGINSKRSVCMGDVQTYAVTTMNVGT